jgi:hypothetical protein
MCVVSPYVCQDNNVPDYELNKENPGRGTGVRKIYLILAKPVESRPAGQRFIYKFSSIYGIEATASGPNTASTSQSDVNVVSETDTDVRHLL